MATRHDILLQRIEERLKALGLSREAASTRAGMSRDGLRNLTRAKGRMPRSENLAKIAAVLETTTSYLLGETDQVADDADGAPPQPEPPQPVLLTPDQLAREAFDSSSEVRLADVRLPSRAEMPLNVPVYGLAAGSLMGTFEGFNFEGEIVDYARRPPALAHIKDAYALYITGHSMEPQHLDGDLRFVNPHKPVRRGDTVAIHIRNGPHAPLQCYIKIFLERRQSGVVARQLNPEATMEFAAQTVVAVHRVLSMNDLFGL
ncbi:helix-turn-helix domain-containing protein [Kaistia geumhonensis]|uniref:Phage repressor protein C with HTH and peptisase S24 domain n=2 Tax=Kaistia geumhonensis TaxID=410839 RepID=A0ABU0M5S7_9HYPH|nr:S24 family peptidase [Kaistia geumhonensis]MCX5478476.1 helix-turn-helix domain-containing protein [Kaistia geumhonensis]MDQ0516306.1 phage repressor protein C with HTH and peptisase S24 domain [Kaistia geumhonensis]